jgi:hypothetical protein
MRIGAIADRCGTWALAVAAGSRETASARRKIERECMCLALSSNETHTALSKCSALNIHRMADTGRRPLL